MSVNKQIYGPLQGKTLKNSLILHLIENYGYQSKPKVAEALISDILSIHSESTKDALKLKPGQIVCPAVLKGEKHGNGKTLAKTKCRHVVLSIASDSDILDYSR